MTKGTKDRKLELIPPLAVSEQPPTGVFEDVEALAGTYVLNLYNDAGRRVGRWEAVEGITDTEMVNALWDFLGRLSLSRAPRLTPA